MPAFRLPILNLAVREQRYSCHGCGNCCRDFTVQLREDDRRRLADQKWEAILGQPVTVEFRGVTYLRQRDDGSCVFLMDNGLCRIHAEHGFSAKPVACQLFPFHLTPAQTVGGRGVGMGINFACQSVLENKGAELRTHVDELRRMAQSIPELEEGQPPRLTERLRADEREAKAAATHIDRWLSRSEVSLAVRLDGLAWVAASLARARLEQVRGPRFDELLGVLFGALPEELAHHPVDSPSGAQMRMLRQAVFMRIEDPKLPAIGRKGPWRLRLDQLLRSRRFRVGRGPVPLVGMNWPSAARFDQVERTAPASGEHGLAIDDLVTRWLRATILGGRAWGAGYYGWPITDGLLAMLLNAACVAWLARLHALGAHEAGGNLAIEDVRAALGRVDRAAGRAPWLGSLAERVRLKYLLLDDGLRRLLKAQRLVAEA